MNSSVEKCGICDGGQVRSVLDNRGARRTVVWRHGGFSGVAR